MDTQSIPDIIDLLSRPGTCLSLAIIISFGKAEPVESNLLITEVFLAIQTPIDTPLGPHKLSANPPKVYIQFFMVKQQLPGAQGSNLDRVAAFVAKGRSLIYLHPYALN